MEGFCRPLEIQRVKIKLPRRQVNGLEVSDLSPQRGVALLAITQRQIKASRRHIAPNRMARKSFPTTIKTLGDRIQAARVEKGLRKRELAQTLRTATSLVNAWETDLETPSEVQWRRLVKILALNGDLLKRRPNI